MALRHALTSAGYYWNRPRELADRLSSEWERRHEMATEATPVPAGAGMEVIHGLLDPSGAGADGPGVCPLCAEFDDVWQTVAGRLPAGHHHDSGLGIVRAAWSATRHLRPDRVIETGVARGFISAVILAALEANGRGRLWSVDLPEVNLVRSGEAAAAVDPALRRRWTWERGSSRRLLPRLAREMPSVDLFVHDSLHTRSNMLFEMGLGWAILRPGGILLVDDIDHNSAFAEFVPRFEGAWAVGVQGNRPGAYGAARKP